MMEESLEAIMALLEGDAPVSHKTDWFELREARLNLRPYTYPRPDVRVASIISPSGPRAAGRFGLGLLSMGATSKEGFEALATSWDIVVERAKEFGQTVDRSRWAVVGPMHIAPTTEQAREDVRYGLKAWFDYFTVAAGARAPVTAATSFEDALEQITSSGIGVIGSPQDAIAQIQRLLDQSGGFGTYLIMVHEWADWAATLRSLELFARYVIPHFQGQLARQEESFAWMQEHTADIHRQFDSAQQKALDDHLAEKAAGSTSSRPA
jgi:limonene 1,2-monooxygenase